MNTNPENKKLVMFDFDGVLIDTLPILFAISSEVNKGIGIEEYKARFDGNVRASMKEFGGKYNMHPNFLEMYSGKTRTLDIPQVLKDTIQELDKNYTLIIVSSSPTSLIKDILERENLNQFFPDILGSDVHNSKVEKIQMSLGKYQALANDAVFITDTLGDIKEANECKVKSIAVSWGFHEKERLQKGNPAKILDNPVELLTTVEDLLK